MKLTETVVEKLAHDPAARSIWTISALGTQVELADGRTGTVVFNGLVGVGVKFGLHDPAPADFEGTSGDLFGAEKAADWPWQPDALLRDPWRDGQTHYDGMQLVGRPARLLRYGLGEEE